MMNANRRLLRIERAVCLTGLLVIGLLLSRPDAVVAQQVNGSGTAGQLPKFTGTTPSSTVADSIITENSGKIGVGTLNPLMLLHMKTGDSVNTLIIDSGSTAPTFSEVALFDRGLYKWELVKTPGNDFAIYESSGQYRLFVKSVSGNVGLGTITPVDRLDITGRLHVSGVCGGGVPNLQGTYLSWNQWCGSGEADLVNHQGGGTGGFAFHNTTDGTNLTTLMRITGGGNVGIGTITPSAKLHVIGTATFQGDVGTQNIAATGNITSTGNISATGTIFAKYQDVAEWVPARVAMATGTVVVLDPEQSNQVMPSAHAYDTRVAGVISQRPGLILGEGGEGKVMVATTGRVRVKVDATSGPIKVGDLLVTSDREGIAMRSKPLDLGGTPIHRPGTLIGKALEPLEKGVGEILVLLSLQ